MKRLSPFLIVGAVLAVAAALLRNSGEPAPEENWTPVDPS